MKQKLLKTWLMLCLLHVGVGTTWAQVSTATATSGKSYILAAYKNGYYYALPHVSSATTYDGTTVTVGNDGKVAAKDGLPLWTLTVNPSNEKQFYLSYTNASNTYYLYKNGTSTSNYNIKGHTSDKNYWEFSKSSDGNYYNVVAVDRGTNHTYLNYYYSKFQVRGTTASTSSNNNTSIILLEVASGSSPTTYNVTIADNITNGTVTASPTSAAENATVTLTATPATGYEFGSWNVTNASTSEAITVTNNKFTMPAANVNVSATFNEIQGGGDEPSGNNLVITYNLNNKSNYPQDFPTSKPNSSNSDNSGTYSIGGNDLSVYASDGEFFYIFNSSKTDESCGLLFGKTATNNNAPKDGTAYLGFPAKTGYKLTKVVATTTSSIGGSISLNIYSTSWGAMSTAKSTTASTSSEFTFELSNPEANTEYRLASGTSSKNLQFHKIVLTYEPVGPAEIPNLIKTSSANLYVGDEIADLKTYLNLPKDYEGTVTFSSASEAVEIEGNYLLATGAGEATVHVVAAANGNYLETTGDITLNISKKTPVIAWTNGTKESYTIFNGKDYTFTSYPTAYLTNSGPSTINYSISNDAIIVDGEPAWESAGTYVVTVQTAENDQYNASNVLTYTINVVDPSITMAPADGTVSAKNPTVTFTGNGVKIDYIDEDLNHSDEKDDTTISVDATETENYYVGITDDAGNTFNAEFNVYFLQDAGLQFAAESQTVSMKAEPFAALELTKKDTDATKVTYSLDIVGDEGKAIAEIDEETGVITLSGTKATNDSRKVFVVATTLATENYAAGEARYQLIIEKLSPELAWSAENVTVDLNEEDKLPTLNNPKGLTITYDSSDKEVADFNNGVLELKKAGTTTISASISSSAYYDATTVTYELTFAPRYTVTFNVNGEETELREETSGAGVTAPTVDPIGDYTFAGWASATVAAETTDAQTFVPLSVDNAYWPTENTTLYAVYMRVEVVEGGSSDEGEFLIYADVNGTKYYMTGKPTASNTTVNQITVTTNRDEAYAYAIAKKEGNMNQYSIAYDDNGVKYLNCIRTGSSSNYSYYLQGNSTEYYFTFSNGAKNGTTRMLSTYSNRAIAFDNNANPKVFKIFSTNNITEGSTQYFDPVFEQISGGSTTYYTTALPFMLTVSSVGYATYYDSSKSYMMPDGMEGYVAYENESDGFVYTKKYSAGEIVPAGEPLVLKASAKTYALRNFATESATFKSQGMNNLEGTDAAEIITDDSNYKYYILSLNAKKEANSVGFYWINENGAAGFTNGAHKAYLKLERKTGENPVKGYSFFDLETGVKSVVTEGITNDATYDLSGRRVSKMNKGIYIVNGKKFVNK